MIDNEKLILLVQNSPELWDKTVKGYNDKNVRELCWDLIGTEMCDNWPKMPENVRDGESKFQYHINFITVQNCRKSPL